MPVIERTAYHLEIKLFGTLQVLVDGEPVRELERREAQWLLAVLALHPGQDMPRAKLAEILFSSDSEIGPKRGRSPTGYSSEQARDSLGKSLNKELRPALGTQADRIHDTTKTIRLDQQGVYIDVSRFVKAFRQEQWNEAIAHYEGEFDLVMDEYPDEARLLADRNCPEGLKEYVEDERADLHTKYVLCLEKAAQQAVAVGEWQRAQRLARRAIKFAFGRLEPYHVLMEAAAGMNRPSLLEREFRRLCRMSGQKNRRIEPESQELFDRLQAELRRRQEAEAAARQERDDPFTPHNIEPLTAPLVGRESDLKAILGHLYTNEGRLVTLWGPGGVGKTWLARQVADTIKARYRDGAWFVDLTPLSKKDGGAIPLQIATALKIDAQTEDALLCLLENSDRLLVLNNCEHLRLECAAFVARLRRRCGRIRVLTTSQQKLGVSGEAVWPVLPLKHPTADEIAAGLAPESLMRDYPAAALFVGRVQPELCLTPQNTSAVAQICARLGGIPLALVMAAARTRPPTVHKIAERLANDGRFNILTQGDLDDLDRPQQHETLRNLLDWSYELLPETGIERPLFRALSVFTDGWPPEAAVAVSGLSEEDAFDVSEDLVNKALVVGDQPDGRQFLLETMREYAHQKLKESGEEAGVTQRFAEWCRGLAAEAEEDRFRPAGTPGRLNQRQWMERLEQEYANIRKALDWYLRLEAGEKAERDGLQLAVNMASFWSVRNRWADGLHYLEAFLDRHSGNLEGHCHSEAHQGFISAACNRAGMLAVHLREYEKARTHLLRGLQLARELGPCHEADVLVNLGYLASKGAFTDIPSEVSSDVVLAKYHQAAVENPADAGRAELGSFWALYGRAWDFYKARNFRDARLQFAAIREIARKYDDVILEGHVLQMLANTSIEEKLFGDAFATCCDRLRLCQRTKDFGSIAVALETLSRVALAEDNWLPAMSFLGTAWKARLQTGVSDDLEKQYLDTHVNQMPAGLEDTLAEWWRIGVSRNRDDILVYNPRRDYALLSHEDNADLSGLFLNPPAAYR